MGDVLMCTPLLRRIKQDFPRCHLTFAIDQHRTHDNTYMKMISNAPFIDKVIDARMVDRSAYEAVVDVTTVCIRWENSNRPNTSRIDIFARAAGFVIRDGVPFYQTKSGERLWATAMTAGVKAMRKKVVVLHTASMDPKRTWPHDKYVALIDANQKSNVHFFILDWNSDSRPWGNFTNATDVSDVDVRKMAALIEQADLFVGPDSGPMHLAAAVHTPSLVIFGSIPPKARINRYPTHTPITHTSLSCLGCWYRQCGISFKCMTELPVSSVNTRMHALLGI